MRLLYQRPIAIIKTVISKHHSKSIERESLIYGGICINNLQCQNFYFLFAIFEEVYDHRCHNTSCTTTRESNYWSHVIVL